MSHSIQIDTKILNIKFNFFQFFLQFSKRFLINIFFSIFSLIFFFFFLQNFKYFFGAIRFFSHLWTLIWKLYYFFHTDSHLFAHVLYICREIKITNRDMMFICIFFVIADWRSCMGYSQTRLHSLQWWKYIHYSPHFVQAVQSIQSILWSWKPAFKVTK